jgi:hypothetical protein
MNEKKGIKRKLCTGVRKVNLGQKEERNGKKEKIEQERYTNKGSSEKQSKEEKGEKRRTN